MRGDVTDLICHGTRPSYKQIKIWGVRVYIINGRVTIKKIDDRSNRGYFVGCASTIEFIIYWKPDQPFVIHRSHHIWYDECNSSLSIEDKHTPGFLLLRQDPESCINNSQLLHLISFILDLKSTPFCDTTIITYEIELPSSGKKVGFHLPDDEDFKIPYIMDTIPN